MVVVVQDLLETVETRPPHRLELIEQLLRSADGLDVAPHVLLASAAPLDDEVGALEDGDVFLHGGEAHVIAPSERRHRGVVEHRSPHDVAARSVSQGMEQPVDILVGPRTYNHMVAR